jgi:hypothetical protein
MNKIALIDIAERVVRTFIQATGAALATGAGGLEVTSPSRRSRGCRRGRRSRSAVCRLGCRR